MDCSKIVFILEAVLQVLKVVCPSPATHTIKVERVTRKRNGNRNPR